MAKNAPLLTPREAAEALTEAGLPISDEAVRGWVKRGTLAGLRLPSGSIRIKREAVQALIDQAALDGATAETA